MLNTINKILKHKIGLLYIQPGKPQQNAYIECYNLTVRHEWQGQYIFETIKEAQDTATRWLWTYNNERPNRRNNPHNETETSCVESDYQSC